MHSCGNISALGQQIHAVRQECFACHADGSVPGHLHAVELHKGTTGPMFKSDLDKPLIPGADICQSLGRQSAEKCTPLHT